MSFRALKQLLERSVVEPTEHQHRRTRQKCGVQLERRVVGGGADQDDGAVLHMRQEGILLRAVEAMDLVDEQKRAASLLAPCFGRVEYLAQIRDAGMNGRQLLEMMVGHFGKQPRHGSLAG